MDPSVLDRAIQSNAEPQLWPSNNEKQNTSVAVSPPHLPYLFPYSFLDKVWSWIPNPPGLHLPRAPNTTLVPQIVHLCWWQKFWSLNLSVWDDILSHLWLLSTFSVASPSLGLRHSTNNHNTSEMAQWVRVPVAKLDNSNSTSGIHMVEGENWLTPVVLWTPHVWHVWVHTHIYK